MWLRRPDTNIYHCKSSSHTLNFLWNKGNIYVMDNHLAAGWCWLNCLSQANNYNFFHVDRHEDLCAGLATQEELGEIKQMMPFGIDDYCEFTVNRDKSTFQYPYNKVFSWDTYIKQIQYMFPNWFEESYFACPNPVWDNPATTILPLNIVYNPTNLELYGNIDYWVCEKRDKQWIFNLDLDYFFDDDGMQIYSDEYIKAFAANLNEAIDNIAVLTIAMSPECCGNWDKSVHALSVISEAFDLGEILEVFNVNKE